MAEKIIVIGNAIAAQIVYAVLSRDPAIDVVAFSVNKQYLQQDTLFGKQVLALETLNQKFDVKTHKVIHAVGYSNLNRNREFTFQQTTEMGFISKTYIHPHAEIMSDDIGVGVFIMPGAVIEPYSVVGNNVVIWSNTVIAHHSIIKENCWIASGSVVAGEATVGKNSFLGVNATIVNKVTVADYNIIGAGVLISKNTAANEVYLARSGEKHRFDSENYSKFYGL